MVCRIIPKHLEIFYSNQYDLCPYPFSDSNNDIVVQLMDSLELIDERIIKYTSDEPYPISAIVSSTVKEPGAEMVLIPQIPFTGILRMEMVHSLSL